MLREEHKGALQQIESLRATLTAAEAGDLPLRILVQRSTKQEEMLRDRTAALTKQLDSDGAQADALRAQLDSCETEAQRVPASPN